MFELVTKIKVLKPNVVNRSNHDFQSQSSCGCFYAKYLVLLITVLSGMWWQNTVDNSRKKLLESRVKMKLPRFCKKVL